MRWRQIFPQLPLDRPPPPDVCTCYHHGYWRLYDAHLNGMTNNISLEDDDEMNIKETD